MFYDTVKYKINKIPGILVLSQNMFENSRKIYLIFQYQSCKILRKKKNFVQVNMNDINNNLEILHYNTKYEYSHEAVLLG